MKKDYIHSYTKFLPNWRLFDAKEQSKTCKKYNVKEFVITDGSVAYTIFNKERPVIKTVNSKDKSFNKNGHYRWLKVHPLTRIFE